VPNKRCCWCSSCRVQPRGGCCGMTLPLASMAPSTLQMSLTWGVSLWLQQHLGWVPQHTQDCCNPLHHKGPKFQDTIQQGCREGCIRRTKMMQRR
jgi:hypothetical protein